jgi:3',5'-cyclic AMP phosphodiesterase CpdA
MLIAQITDIHLGFEPDTPDEFNRLRLDRTVQALLEMDPRPDLLLATGDLVDRGDRKATNGCARLCPGCRFRSTSRWATMTSARRFARSFPKRRSPGITCNT